jgi:hypothetical protein
MAIESIPMYRVRSSAVTYQSASPTRPRGAGEPSLRNIALADRLGPRSVRTLMAVGGVPQT